MPTAVWWYQRLLYQWTWFRPVMCLIHYSPSTLFIYLLPRPVSLHNIIKHSYKEPQSQTNAPFLLCLPSEIPSAENRKKANWAAWQLEATKIIFLAATVSARCFFTWRTTANGSLLFQLWCFVWPQQGWSLTFGPAWNAPSECGFDCRWWSWCETQEHTSESIQESTEGKFNDLFSAAHHKGAAKYLIIRELPLFRPLSRFPWERSALVHHHTSGSPAGGEGLRFQYLEMEPVDQRKNSGNPKSSLLILSCCCIVGFSTPACQEHVTLLVPSAIDALIQCLHLKSRYTICRILATCCHLQWCVLRRLAAPGVPVWGSRRHRFEMWWLESVRTQSDSAESLCTETRRFRSFFFWCSTGMNQIFIWTSRPFL